MTVKANRPATGLGADDVFYFGNAIGEVGDSTSNALVNAADVSAIRANPRSPLNPAPITFAYDINRDRLVDSSDVATCRANQTSPLNGLRLITVP